MLHSLLGAWRTSLRRTRADWPILVAAAVITIVASTLLAAGPIYSAAVVESGLHRELRSAPIAAVNIEVLARVAPDDAAETSDTVQRVLRESVGSPITIRSAGMTSSFALPDQPTGEVRDLATLGFLDGVEAHATLVDGAWPVAATPGEPLQLAVIEPIATTLGLEVGRMLSLTSRLDRELVVAAVVSAIYRPTDRGAAYWWDDPSLLDGRTEGGDYRTFGPLLTTRDDLLARAVAGSLRLSWHAFPDIDAIPIAGVTGLRLRMEQLPTRMTEALPGEFPDTNTGLPALLASAERSLLVSRTGVLLLLVQLAVLAGYAIALTADLIVDHRRVDTALLRSRGASTRQVALLALAEALLLAVPGALLGPWLAAIALQLFNLAGPLAGIGLDIAPQISSDAFVVSGVAAVGCAVLIVLPAFVAARSFATERSVTARPGTRPLGQRVGLDVALLAITAIGLWQLQLYGSPLTRSVRGTLGVDPLLIAAPAIGILAGGVLALRIVPLLAHLADLATTRGRSLVGSLGARQLARRPLRYTRTAMLIMLAVAMGVFSVAYGTTWTGSQREQADYQAGADLRVSRGPGGGGVDPAAIGPAYAALPGVAAVMSLARDSVRFTRTSGTGDLVELDAASAGAAVTGVTASAALERRTALDALFEARPALTGLAVPGTPSRLAMYVTVLLDRAVEFDYDYESGEAIARPVDPAVIERDLRLSPAITIRDSRGLFHRFAAEGVQRIPGPQRLEIPIPDAAATPLDYPLEVVGLDLQIEGSQSQMFVDYEASGHVLLNGLGAAGPGPDARWVPIVVGSPDGWAATYVTGEPGESTFEPAVGGQVGVPLQLPPYTPNGRFGLRLTRASIASLAGAAMPIVANGTLLRALKAAPGDLVTVQMPGGPRGLRIVGEVEGFPTTRHDRPLVIADLPTFAAIRYASSGHVETADDWWLALTADASPDLVAGRATGAFGGASVVSRAETRARLTTEPLAVGMIGALSLGFVAAGLFAVIGLAVSATVSARQRRTEFALLRALGLSPDQLSAWLWLENAGVVIVSLAAGTGLGLVIGWVVLPFITVSQTGTTPFPPVAIDVPWLSVLVLEAISAAALAITLIALGRSIRRAGVGGVLRMGED